MFPPPPRLYRDEDDLNHMANLLQEGRAARNGSYYVHTGDLKWWLYYPPLGKDFWNSIYLWEDALGGGQLLGWALLSPLGETYDVYFRPELRGTQSAEAMYTWAEEKTREIAHANQRRKIGVMWVLQDDEVLTRRLEKRGYCIAAEYAALSRSLADPVPAWHLPEGYGVRPCRGLQEVEARARAQYGAFGSHVPFEQYLERFTRFMGSPAYQPSADMLVQSPDSRVAAFCITWTDTLNRIALFEPVGTHPDFQRKGLGKAVLLAALHYLREQGMQQVIICTEIDNAPAIHLYQSVGFEPYNRFRFYQKEIT